VKLRFKHNAAPLVAAAMIAITAATLGGCSSALYQQEQTARTGSVRAATLRAMDKLNMDRAAPVLVRIYKEDSTLEVWKQNRTGRFALLGTYPICKYSGNLGPKIATGDYQAPEGFYDITPDQMNPMSTEYLAFNTGFPNAYDRSLGRTGSFLMVHGGCRSVGCYAMTDAGIEEIYGLVDDAFKGGQDRVQLQAFPFRMTAQNIARHAGDPNIPFWEMLRTGSDAFHATGRAPTVAVCERRYVFNATITDEDLDPSGPCPPAIASATLPRAQPASTKAQTGRLADRQ
jgi:murein L,D-transpeptidase YafK